MPNFAQERRVQAYVGCNVVATLPAEAPNVS